MLIVGCGDVGLRLNALLQGRARVVALTSTPARKQDLRAQGITPLLGNLDHPATLHRLSGLATRVVHLAPPPGQGQGDPRTLALVRVLMRRSPARSLVYGSTSGVYGNCHGDWIAETRRLRPETPRALRRVDAEAQIRFLGQVLGLRVSILRIPGIYAPDRDGGTPRARLLKAVPVLRAQDDVYTNHIHADDLARACQLAVWRGAAQRAYHINDNTSMKMGDYFDAAADLYSLPRPPRISLAEAQQQLSPMLLSFMQESRRMLNVRMQRELRLRLHYPDVVAGLAEPP